MKNIMQKIIFPAVTKFINTKAMVAVKDGTLFMVPLTMIGSIFLLLANFPYKPFTDFLQEIGMREMFNQVSGATYSIMALIAVAGITYTYVKNEGFEPMSGAVISISTFILLLRPEVVTKGGETVGDVIPKMWTAGQGIICSIIIGLLVGYVYSLLLRKKIRIKMPSSVPEGVSNSFASLIPGLIIITGAVVVYSFFHFALNTTLVEFIYKVIQAPMQSMSDSLGAAILVALMISLFWWFGVHGTNVVGSMVYTLFQANTLANLALLNSGKAVTLANGAHIVNEQFYNQFITVTGAGITIGLVINFCFLCKATQYKQLGRMTIIPGLFNINEPVLFGTPIVLNPHLIVPFIAVPIVSVVLTYTSIATGLVPPFKGVSVPWTCPPVISGALIGGWRAALLQAVILVLSVLIYMPFVRKMDKTALEQENASSCAE
ncbi:MAG: PTS sugar transporter subunit IIC [Lachnospiraceae bacterium]|nr:PTS sugar transporter subunit IIC [Lachnospiraceae bacterium]